ncbi:hypothetical protein ZIOFF_070131 [Zingiber officinale]|uniref:Uncharacterized protein n=1 Tax=Zingiber officinale TaxID=94328 RepID=A0A8J5EUD9_ZINOF|nr:hypothetical protein ZIOFF_070131 [Zingiber officinale]
MFTEGLDPHALRWVHEGHASATSVHPRMDQFGNFRDGGRGLGIPPPEKFRSGHLPLGSIPMSHAIPTRVDSQSGSDMDETSDAEAEIYGMRHSVDSSPVDEVSGRRVPIGTFRPSAFSNRSTGLGSTQNYYSSDGYSDISSSVDTTRKQPQQTRKLVQSEYMKEEDEEDGLSDSGRSSEFSSQVERHNTGATAPLRSGYVSESYSCNVPQRPIAIENANAGKVGRHSKFNYTHNAPSIEGVSVSVSSDKLDPSPRTVYHSKGYSKHVPLVVDPTEKAGLSDYPSAPPIHGYDKDITDDASEQIAGVRSPAKSNGSIFMRESMFPANARTNQSETTTSLPQRNCPNTEAARSSSLLPARLPTFHASAQGPWFSVIAYDACVRLCLHSWARGCMEAPIFLDNECALLRDAFSVRKVLLQSEEELLAKRSSELVCEGAGPKPKKIVGKMKVQVRKVRMALDIPSGCSFSSLRQPMVNLESLRLRMLNLQSTLSSGWESLRKVRVMPNLPATSSFSRHSLAYMHASAQYIKQVSGLLKIGVGTLRSSSSSYEITDEHMHGIYSHYTKRLRGCPKFFFLLMYSFPDSLGDDLIIDVYDSKAKSCGRVVVQVACIADDPVHDTVLVHFISFNMIVILNLEFCFMQNDKLRWWPIYHEPEHELVGRVQLYISYATNPDENNGLKCGSVAETVAYDVVLEVAMKVQHFQQRSLLLHGSWKWLLTEFASYYGVSDSYTKLRYLSYIMDVATPTADCLTLVHDLLLPVILKSRNKNSLSHQEFSEQRSSMLRMFPDLVSLELCQNRILGEIEEQIEQILAIVFENYKSLDESLPSGISEVFRHTTGSPALALVPAMKLFTLLHDILTPEAQLKLCSHFQIAAKKRSRRHLLETDEYVANNSEANRMDAVGFANAYQKMRTLCFNIRNEIFTDIEIHNEHVLPRWVSFPFLYSYICPFNICDLIILVVKSDCPTISLPSPVLYKCPSHLSIVHDGWFDDSQANSYAEHCSSIGWVKCHTNLQFPGSNMLFLTEYSNPPPVFLLPSWTTLQSLCTCIMVSSSSGHLYSSPECKCVSYRLLELVSLCLLPSIGKAHILCSPSHLHTSRSALLLLDDMVPSSTTISIKTELAAETSHLHFAGSFSFAFLYIDANSIPPYCSFLDLPNLSASIYSVELSTRLRSLLVTCPPGGPSQPVADVVIATADFEKDLTSWNICPVKGGVDAKELFHLYIILWIQDKRLALLESCKLDKVPSIFEASVTFFILFFFFLFLLKILTKPIKLQALADETEKNQPSALSMDPWI